MGTVVRLGNAAPIHGTKEDPDNPDVQIPNVLPRGDYVAEITVHDDVDPHHDIVRNITHVDGMWTRLSDEPATWVSCPELPRLEMALAAHFDCPIRDADFAHAKAMAAYDSPGGNVAAREWPEDAETEGRTVQ